MTLQEKIGQLNQYTDDAKPTGPLVVNPNKEKDIKKVLSIGFGVGLSWGGCIINMEKWCK